MENISARPSDTLLSRDLSALLDHQAVRWAILFTAACFLLFAQANQSRIYGDAIRYSGEARAMADSGEYATLRFGQEPNHHGPLLFWLSAFAIKAFGANPFAATLFSRLFGVGCVIMTAWLGSYLFDEKIAWISALALATNYTFFRNTTTLRMDSGLTFGVLLALAGYLRGERRWGPPLFYGGIAVAVLAKSIAGFLPLFLAPLHAILARQFYLPWRKQSLRWLCWSPLLFIPLAWWGYLSMHYGTAVFSSIVADFQESSQAGVSRLYEFMEIYVFGFGMSYILWLPFALIGIRMALRAAFDSKTEAGQRAVLGLLLGWVGIVFLSGGLKPGEYERYLMPALPAISIMSAMAVVWVLRDQIPAWLPGIVGTLTVVAAIGMTCLPVSAQFGERQRMLAMEEILNRRLVPHSSVPIIRARMGTPKNPRGFWADQGRCRFFFGRDSRPTTIAEAREAAARGRFTAIVPKTDYPLVVDQLKLAPLIETSFWVLAEVGSGKAIALAEPTL
jgi:4-amino-4-deoxy-L-arabinose transferase-like glycosyltransferase